MHLAETCLLCLTYHITQQAAKGLCTGMPLLDVQNAFDSVNHSKLYSIAIDPTWFLSCLSNTKQTVCVNCIFSEFLVLSCGVPQGSVLGPLLYLCYSNDMELSVSFKLYLYEDDSVFLLSHRDPNIISNKLGWSLLHVTNG